MKLASSVTSVQFMVHRRGIHLPVASQKGAMPPDLSTIGVSEAPNSVPEVPREMTQLPSVTAPAPSALIWLSPLPGATMTSGERPSSSATSFFNVPTTWRSQRRLVIQETTHAFVPLLVGTVKRSCNFFQ